MTWFSLDYLYNATNSIVQWIYPSEPPPIEVVKEKDNDVWKYASAISAIALSIIAIGSVYFCRRKKEVVLSKYKTPIFIPNIFKLTNKVLKDITVNTCFKYFTETGQKLGIKIDCAQLTKEELVASLELLRRLYKDAAILAFENLKFDLVNLKTELQKFDNLSCVCFSNTREIKSSSVKTLVGSVKKLKRLQFQRAAEKKDELRFLENKYIVSYSDGQSNRNEKINEFKEDIQNLLWSIRAQEAQIKERAIRDFLSQINKKTYFPVFDDPNVELDLSDIFQVSDVFMGFLLDFFRENNLNISSLNLSGLALNGNFIEKGAGLGIKTLILSDMERIEITNLHALSSYPVLKNLDISNSHITNESLEDDILSLPNLKRLILNNCRYLRPTELRKDILIKAQASLEYLSLEGTQGAVYNFIEEIIEDLKKPFIFVSNRGMERTVHFFGCDGISQNSLLHLYRIQDQVTELKFGRGVVLYLNDFNALIKCSAFQNIRMLDLTNVKIIDHNKIMPRPSHGRSYSECRGNAITRRKQRFSRPVLPVVPQTIFDMFKGIHPLQQISRWQSLRNIELLGFSININRNDEHTADSVIIQHNEIDLAGIGMKEEQRPLLLEAYRANLYNVLFIISKFRNIRFLNFAGIQYFDIGALNALARLSDVENRERVAIENLDLSNTNLSIFDYEGFVKIHGDRHCPANFLQTLFKSVASLNLQGIKRIDRRDQIIPAESIFSGWKKDSATPLIRRGNIGNQRRVNITLERNKEITILPA